jgi:hypothetical protein
MAASAFTAEDGIKQASAMAHADMHAEMVLLIRLDL